MGGREQRSDAAHSCSLGGTGVLVGGTGVLVGGTGVFVGGTGVLVGGTGVLVGGTGVLVGGTGVSVGGTGVSVGGVASRSAPEYRSAHPGSRSPSEYRVGSPRVEVGVGVTGGMRVGRHGQAANPEPPPCDEWYRSSGSSPA